MTRELAYSPAVVASAVDAWSAYAGVFTSDAKQYDERGTSPGRCGGRTSCGRAPWRKSALRATSDSPGLVRTFVARLSHTMME